MADSIGKSIMIPDDIVDKDQSDDKQQGQVGKGGDEKTTSSQGGKGKRKITKGEGSNQSKDYDNHIRTERERRKRMRDMYTDLQNLVPHIPVKADKSTVVELAVAHIKSLQNTLGELQKQKLERVQQIQSASITNNNNTTIGTTNPWTSPFVPIFNNGDGNNNGNVNTNMNNPIQFQNYWASPNVGLNICGDVAHFNVCSSKKQCLFTNICFVLEKNKIQVLSAHVSSYGNQSFYMIQAKVDRASNQVAEALIPVEDTFKQAAEEISQCLS